MGRILIVEDSQQNCDLLKEILKGTAELEIASSGNQAVRIYNEALAAKKFFDLILLDIGLPEISGIEILGRIRDSERTSGIPLGQGVPVVMITAYERRFLEAFDKGCDNYILKPFDPDYLLKTVKKYLP